MASIVSPLHHLYHSAYSKYLKYKTRFERSVQSGRFARFSGRKRAQLTHRLRKLRDKVLDLHCRLKFGIAGGAVALALVLAQPAEAQTTLGPFEPQQRSGNPLRSPIERYDDDITVAVDYDNDGDKDLVIGHYDDIRLFINNGSGSELTLDEADDADNPFLGLINYYEEDQAPAFADLDEDGDMDLFVGTNYGDIHYFVNNNGDFTEVSYAEPWVHTAGVPGATGNPLSGVLLTSFPSAVIPAFADYDGDGDLDLLIGHDVESDPSDALYGAVDIVENSDNEGFSLVPRDINPFFDFWWTDIGDRSIPRMVDVDNDGDLDLLTAHDGGEGLPGVILCRNNDGIFEVELDYGTFGGGYYSAIEFADFDDDGDQDAIVTDQAPFNSDDQRFKYYVNDGTFTFEQKYSLQNPFGGVPDPLTGHTTSITNPALIDIDDDEDMDAFVGVTHLINPNFGPSKVIFYRYDHITQEYSEEDIDSPGSNGSEFQSIPVTVDIDGDADLDLFISSAYGALDLFLNNDADEGFTKVEPSNALSDAFNTGNVTIMPAFIDMDGDGDLDAFIAQSAKYSQATIRFFENTGTSLVAEFTEVIGPDNLFDGMSFVHSGGLAPRSISISVSDINNDERSDIFIGDALGQVQVFQQDEDDFDPNTFNSFIQLTGIDNPFTNPTISQNPNSQLIDFDNDGDKDIFTGNSYYGITYQINTNPAPAITSIAGDVIFPNSGPVVLDANLTLTDSDNDLIQKATVTLNPEDPGYEDLYVASALPGFTSQFQDGILEIVGPLTVADFQDILRTVTYEFDAGGGSQRKKGSAAGRTINKTATFRVFDQDGTIAPSSTVVLNLTHSNDPPTISPSSLNASYTGTPLVLNSGIVLNDNDDPNLLSAEVAITTNFQFGEDELLFTPVTGLLANFDPASGVLIVTGNAPLADYTTFLQSVQYRNLSATPTGSSRVIQFKIFDVDDPSNPAVVNLSLPSTAPNISSGITALLYAAPSVIIDNSFTVTDPDNSTLASATIMFNAGFISAEDRLLFTNTGSITGAFSTVTGILTLTGAASIAEYESALESISYENLSPTPNKQNRIVSFVVSDGPHSSNAHTVSISFPNIAPALSPSTVSATYSGVNLVLNSTLSIVDDDANMASATIAITAGFVSAEDELVFINQNGITGSFSAVTGILTLTGATTIANYQTALRSVEYRNIATNRTSNNRTIAFTVDDGVAQSNISTVTLAVPNSPPSLSSAAAAKNYTSGNLVVDNSIVITDTDHASLASAEVTISSGYLSGEDELLFINQNGISGTFTSATGILTLTGNATLADYQTAVRSVEYRNIGAAHTAGVRTISFSVNDGVATSAVLNVSINVINQAPTITGTASGFYTSGDLIINNSIVLTDTDNSNLQSAVASITSGFQSGEDVLVFSNQNGITGNYNASTGVLSLSGNASISNYQGALRSIQYRNTSATPNTADRSITFTVNDGNNTSSPATTIIVINKPPAISVTPQITQAGGNVVFLVANILSDPDNNLDLTSLTIVSAQGASITISSGIITIDYSNVPDYEGTDQLTITVCDLGGKCRTENVFIEVGAEVEVFNGISANGDGVNDYFRIRFLPAGAKVSIYNRWGDSVYEMEGYDNNDKNKRFEGYNASGNELTSGTYFYKVSLSDGKEYTGYLLLKR